MSLIFSPNGSLNIAADSSELQENSDGTNTTSGAMTRCKNLRLNEQGKAKTRDGSAKLNASAINTSVYWIEEQAGYRYTFAGTIIYRNETSIVTGLTSAQWSAIKYNAFNDITQNVFALNGTDRKRIKGTNAYEWGIAEPTFAPTISAGPGTGLTGLYNVKYTYVRKVGNVVVAESNPSPAASDGVNLSDQTISVEIDTPTDSQITHARFYRTLAGGDLYYLDSEIDISGYDYGYAYSWESADAYISGTGYKFTTTSTATESATSTGAASTSVSISNQPAFTYAPLPGPATALYQLGSNGVASVSDFSGIAVPISNEWLIAGTASDYEVQATVSSGSVSSGTTGSWLSLGSTQIWTVETTSGTSQCVLLIEIRDAATQTVQTSATITLEADCS